MIFYKLLFGQKAEFSENTRKIILKRYIEISKNIIHVQQAFFSCLLYSFANT